MSFFQEFKKFISRGSAIDMAVGIIVGASFTKVVDVFVNHILMPPIGILMEGVNYSSIKIILKKATEASPAVAINLGLFLSSLVNFLLVGVSVFALIKIANRLHIKRAVFEKKVCPECRMEIPLDALRCGHCTAVLLTQEVKR